ncbi:tail fiber protein [Escherichia coli]|uniref:tail fiber protein n=1 Tax=Escherichia coli TaxID=562 RepID=UPI003CD021C8
MEDASLTTKGVVKLSSAVDSTSESLAATPKAVKAANDNANSRLAKNQNGADIQDKSAFLDNVGVTSLTFMKNNGEMPVDADLNAFGPVEAYLGVWSKATSTNATLEKNFPEDNAVGVLEVFAAGNFAGTQRFTTRDGNVYIRRLANKWNGSDGPWGIWRHTQSATRPLSTAIDLNTLGAAEHLGLWRNSSSAIASYERNYPEEGGFAQGMLEILEGGNYGRTQRYTTRRGNMYVRCLAASWDASNPQWEPWLRVGHQSESRYYEGDLNVLTDPGIYSVTGKASNGPLLDSSGATLLGVLEVIRRFDYVAVLQRYTTTGTGTTTKGRSYERVYTASSWSEWREVYTSYSLPLNLGIGGAAAKLTSLDWQTYDFVPGSLITVRLDNMTNIPDGMDWGVIDGNLINIAVGPSDDTGTGRSMHVWRSTVSKANYRFFMVRISGNPGSRTITARRVPIIDEAQTWSAHQTFSGGLGGELSGNAATATKLQTARTIGGVSFDGTANINLPGVNAAGNQNTTGNAATATKLQTARTINGVSFNGSANISIPTITSRGRVTALTGTTQGAATGLQMYEAYNNGYPSDYGNVLHLKGATAVGEGELFIGWSGTSGAHAPVHVRSRRDTDTASWSEWAQVYTSKDSIPGVNATGNQNTTGNAASATKLQTARTIGGVSFNGTANINLPGVNIAGNQNTTGNAASATKLQTARTIGGVSFNGTANINLPGVNIAGNQNTTGNAATATKLQTARKIAGVAFDGSADITLTATNVNAYTKTEVTNLLSSYVKSTALPSMTVRTSSVSGGDMGMSLSAFISHLRSNGAFSKSYWIGFGDAMGFNAGSINNITGFGAVELAESIIEVFNLPNGDYTIRLTTSHKADYGGVTNAILVYHYRSNRSPSGQWLKFAGTVGATSN